MSLFELFPLPPDLDPTFLAWLETYVATLAPRDPHETLLVGRIAQALARLHRSALYEPAGLPSGLWLRYEAAADRLYRQSLTALHKYRKEHPVDPHQIPDTFPDPASTPHPSALAPDPREPSPHNTLNPLPDPGPDNPWLDLHNPDPAITPTPISPRLPSSADPWPTSPPRDGLPIDPTPGDRSLKRPGLAHENGHPRIRDHDGS